jgi:hypothetical protein
MIALGIRTPLVYTVTLPEPDGQPRIHFGSLVSVAPEKVAIYDLLPDRFLETIANRDDFWGAMVFDKWTSNADRRQCIFYRVPAQHTAWIVEMIDNACAFQGGDWTYRESAVQGLYTRASVYGQNPTLRPFESWLQRLMALDRSVLEQARVLVPNSWIVGQEAALDRLLLRLWLRRERVADLIVDSVRWLQSCAARKK